VDVLQLDNRVRIVAVQRDLNDMVYAIPGAYHVVPMSRCTATMHIRPSSCNTSPAHIFGIATTTTAPHRHYTPESDFQ
jgi:hypothetical protein